MQARYAQGPPDSRRPGAGCADGVGRAARFHHPAGLAIGPADGRLYVADHFNHRVRCVDIDVGLGATATASGATGATGSATAAARCYGRVTTVAGDGVAGFVEVRRSVGTPIWRQNEWRRCETQDGAIEATIYTRNTQRIG